MKDVSMKELKNKATEMRMKVVDMIYKAQSGHPGGSLSAADFMTACYFKYMNVDPKNPQWEDRDRMVLSKGHVCPIQYACLGTLGFFPEEELDTLRQEGSKLQGHPSMNKCPGIDISTGSLGQGLSVAAGIAFAKKIEQKENTIFCIIGDGESQEGQNWEAVMFAAQQKLGNLILFVDDNKQQLDNMTSKICNMDSFAEKFRSFHWDVQEVDGHNINELNTAITTARNNDERPHVIVMNTIKGKGCSFAENILKNHHINVSAEQAEDAVNKLKR